MKTIITTTLTTKKISIKEDLTYIAILSKGWKSKKTLTFDLVADNSRLTFIALILGKNNAHFQFETLSIQNSKKTHANFTIKSALTDSSKVDYTGLLRVSPKARETESHLTHDSLMLSDSAKTHTFPALEIQAADAKASHQAAIGKIDEELLFYLASRGISKSSAKKILTNSFFEEILSKISDNPSRIQIQKILNNLLTTY